MKTTTFTTILSALALGAMLLASTPLDAASYRGGWYAGGVGSSHKGGHYTNPYTGNHYQHRR